jgi:hypothetical protein
MQLMVGVSEMRRARKEVVKILQLGNLLDMHVEQVAYRINEQRAPTLYSYQIKTNCVF